jgi:hypothetical protein
VRRSAVPLLSVALAVALAACGDDADGTATPSFSPFTTPEKVNDLRPGDMVESSVVYCSPASVPLLGAIRIDFPQRRLPSGAVMVQIDPGCQSWYVHPSGKACGATSRRCPSTARCPATASWTSC